MPSTASALTTLLFGLSLLAPVVLVLAGIVFALITRSKSWGAGQTGQCSETIPALLRYTESRSQTASRHSSSNWSKSRHSLFS